MAFVDNSWESIKQRRDRAVMLLIMLYPGWAKVGGLCQLGFVLVAEALQS